MKKLATILLLVVFSFNLIGYKFLFDYLQAKSDRQLEAALDSEQYNEKDLMTIRIPLSMPYQPENTDFERVDGEITLQGVIYRYVKRKIDRGELVLLCVPDERKMQLESGKDEFFQLASMFLQYTPKSHAPVKTTTIFKLSIFDVPALGFCAPLSRTLRLRYFLSDHTFFPSPFIGNKGQPPDRVYSFLA